MRMFVGESHSYSSPNHALWSEGLNGIIFQIFDMYSTVSLYVFTSVANVQRLCKWLWDISEKFQSNNTRITQKLSWHCTQSRTFKRHRIYSWFHTEHIWDLYWMTCQPTGNKCSGFYSRSTASLPNWSKSRSVYRLLTNYLGACKHVFFCFVFFLANLDTQSLDLFSFIHLYVITDPEDFILWNTKGSL